MNDIFYLARYKYSLTDIQYLLEKSKDCFTRIFHSANTIEVTKANLHFNIVLMDIEEFPEEADLNQIRKKGIQIIMCISHHQGQLKEIVDILKLFMEFDNGWIGNDSEGFEPIYNIDEIRAAGLCCNLSK